MSTGVVWFVQEVDHPDPAKRPSPLEPLPRMDEVSILDSLLVACA